MLTAAAATDCVPYVARHEKLITCEIYGLIVHKRTTNIVNLLLLLCVHS